MKITNHHELRKDVSLDCSSPLITDQSYKNACDINVIMANYVKTGMLSHTTTITPKYLDCTEVPSLERAYELIYAAEDAFAALPPDVRKLMDNNPSNLELFIQNPVNADILERNGLILKKEPKQTDPVLKEVLHDKTV